MAQRTEDALEPQLWLDYYGHEPNPARFKPVENRGPAGVKPRHGTGLWTSTLDAEGCWIDWCLTDAPDWLEGDQVDGKSPRGAWVLHPRSDLRIFTISTYGDLEQLVERFPIAGIVDDDKRVDWEAASREFDAIHMTDAGQWATRLSMPLSLYGWDCESTLWMAFAFERWEPIDLAECIAHRRKAVDTEKAAV